MKDKNLTILNFDSTQVELKDVMGYGKANSQYIHCTTDNVELPFKNIYET